MPARLPVEITDWVALRARTHPDGVAVEVGGAQLTYRDVDRLVGTAAGALRSLGVDGGEPVAVLAGNGLEIVRFAHAIPRSGAMFMPLNARLSAEEIAYQL
ncbi:MAG: 2-succinylbenzoate-CoA ligase, partial [Chloroflexi bacterium]|nr:2-succinylbenzoate-CoA ligase [Chloroflexota bacterium]